MLALGTAHRYDIAPPRVPFGLATVLAAGDAVPPGIGLIVVVLRTLLVQAIAREAEARELRDELDEVSWCRGPPAAVTGRPDAALGWFAFAWR